MLEELQAEWKQLQEEERKLKERKKQFKEKVESNGFTLQKDKIVPNEVSWALHWNILYYNDYISEKGVMQDILKGAKTISSQEYVDILTAFNDKDEECLSEILGAITGGEDYYFDGNLLSGDFTVNQDRSIRWEANEAKRSVIGSLLNGSFFEVKKMSTSEIKAIPNVYKENVMQ